MANDMELAISNINATPKLKGWLERHHDVTLLHEAEFKEIVHVFAIVSPPVFGVNTNNNLSSNGWDFDVRFVMMGVEFRLYGIIDISTLSIDARFTVRIPIFGEIELAKVVGNLTNGISVGFDVIAVTGEAKFYIGDHYDVRVTLTAKVFGQSFGPSIIKLLQLPSYNSPFSITAEAQWVIIVLKNLSKDTIKVRNVTLAWGKFHEDGDKSKDRALKEIEGATILPGKSYQINSCGSFGTPSGTTGSFELAVSDHLDTLIRRFNWDCPWGSKTNTWKIVGSNSEWLVDSSGENLDGGALGTITVQAVKFSDLKIN